MTLSPLMVGKIGWNTKKKHHLSIFLRHFSPWSRPLGSHFAKPRNLCGPSFPAMSARGFWVEVTRRRYDFQRRQKKLELLRAAELQAVRILRDGVWDGFSMISRYLNHEHEVKFCPWTLGFCSICGGKQCWKKVLHFQTLQKIWCTSSVGPWLVHGNGVLVTSPSSFFGRIHVVNSPKA